MLVIRNNHKASRRVYVAAAPYAISVRGHSHGSAARFCVTRRRRGAAVQSPGETEGTVRIKGRKMKRKNRPHPPVKRNHSSASDDALERLADANLAAGRRLKAV